MTKIPPNEFIKTDIGKIDNNPSWNNIPSDKLVEYVPEGKSLEEVNKRKEELREYFKRNNQIIIFADAATGFSYQVPQNYIFMIDTLAITATNVGAAATTAYIQVYNSAMALLYTLSGVRVDVGEFNSTSITYNNPIKINEFEYVVGTTAAAHQHTYMITGWLEDKTLLS